MKRQQKRLETVQNGKVRNKKTKDHWLSGPVVEAFTYPKLLVKDYVLSIT